MSAAARTKVVRPKRKIARFIPAMAFVIVSLGVASGVSVLPMAGAANPENVLVTGSVGETISVTQSGCSGTGADLGALAAAAQMTSTNCQMTVATNRPTGYYLGVQEDNVTGGATRPANTYPAFCRVTATGNACANVAAGDNDDSVGNITGGTALNATADKFGLLGVTGGTAVMNGTGSWTAGAAAVGTAQWQPVGETGSSNRSCDVTGPTAGLTCLYRFGAYIGGTQNAGTYEAKVAFLAVAD